MKVCVFGATGLSGQRVVQQSLDAGLEVMAIVRNPQKLAHMKHDQLKIIQADVLNTDELVPHLADCDVVMSCLGYPNTYFREQYFHSQSCKAIIEAMRRANGNVTRFIAMTAWCTIYKPEHPKYIEWLIKPILNFRKMADMARMESYLMVECKDIAWTCVKPPGLTNGPLTGKNIKSVEGQFVPDASSWISWISRADVARFMLSIATTDDWKNKLVAIAT